MHCKKPILLQSVISLELNYKPPHRPAGRKTVRKGEVGRGGGIGRGAGGAEQESEEESSEAEDEGRGGGNDDGARGLDDREDQILHRSRSSSSGRCANAGSL